MTDTKNTTAANPYLKKQVLRQFAAEHKASLRYPDFAMSVRLSRSLDRKPCSRNENRKFSREDREFFYSATLEGFWAIEDRFGSIPRSDTHIRHVLEALKHVLRDLYPLPSARSLRRWLADWEDEALRTDAVV